VSEKVDLFSEPTRERLGPLGHSEPHVNWYRESTRPEAVLARRNINDWYRSFPDRDGKLARKLRSERNAEHIPALDELFTHHVLSQRPGQSITYEEGGRGPDFRLYRRRELVGSVEVLSLFQKREWTKEEERHARLADGLNKRLDLSHGYFVTFQIVESDANLSPAKFAEWVRRQLKQLPNVRDGSAARFPLERSEQPIAYEPRGARIDVRFLPLYPDRVPEPGGTDRIVAAGPLIFGLVADSERIRDRVAEKAGQRYELREAPYLVLVVVHSSLCDNWDFINALYGSSAVDVRSGEATRKHDGLFGLHQGKWKSRRLSAVCGMAERYTITPEETGRTLYHNPGAHHRWSSDLLDANREFGVSTETDQSVQLDWLTT
jgi:hypothetical protein